MEVEIARRRATRARLALSGEPQLRAFTRTDRNLDVEASAALELNASLAAV